MKENRADCVTGLQHYLLESVLEAAVHDPLLESALDTAVHDPLCYVALSHTWQSPKP